MDDPFAELRSGDTSPIEGAPNPFNGLDEGASRRRNGRKAIVVASVCAVLLALLGLQAWMSRQAPLDSVEPTFKASLTPSPAPTESGLAASPTPTLMPSPTPTASPPESADATEPALVDSEVVSDVEEEASIGAGAAADSQAVGSPGLTALDPRFRTCGAALAAGFGNYIRGVNREYRWYRDADRDGVVCER